MKHFISASHPMRAQFKAQAAYPARHFSYAFESGIATIALNRPDKKNPLTFDSYGEPEPWQSWPGAVVLAKGAAIQFRLSANGGTLRPLITQLTVNSVAQRATQVFTSVAMSAGGTRLPPASGNPPYTWIAGGVRGVQVTPIGALTGTVVGARVIDFDSTNGPLAVLVDGSGAAIAGSATVSVEGLIDV